MKHIFTDGSCIPNRNGNSAGPIGWGVAFQQDSGEWYSTGDGSSATSTNNIAELKAVLLALQLIAKKLTSVKDFQAVIVTDSDSSRSRMSDLGGPTWNEVRDKQLVADIHAAYEQVKGHVSFEYVKAHQAVDESDPYITGNHLADAKAKEMAYLYCPKGEATVTSLKAEKIAKRVPSTAIELDPKRGYYPIGPKDVLGNPLHTKLGPEPVETIEVFEEEFYNSLDDSGSEVMRALNMLLGRMNRGEDIKLVCGCKSYVGEDIPCHGVIIANYLNKNKGQTKVKTLEAPKKKA